MSKQFSEQAFNEEDFDPVVLCEEMAGNNLEEGNEVEGEMLAMKLKTENLLNWRIVCSEWK